jgi:hypothetical protein
MRKEGVRSWESSDLGNVATSGHAPILAAGALKTLHAALKFPESS